LPDLNLPLAGWRNEALPQTVADQTRRVYDLLATVYPLTSRLLHSRAHDAALEMSELKDGIKVLEIATGSGEMFRRIVESNPSGMNVGIDLSPKMASHTARRIERKYPSVASSLQAVDVRSLPFRDATFDSVICCFLLELLDSADVRRTLREVHRVLRPQGRFTVALIGQQAEGFNQVYNVAGRLVPSYWGRLIDKRVPGLLADSGFRVLNERQLRQGFYPSRVIAAQVTR
jgi:ubiquinone/menaquinone biosynthesis C-methylase UbiE